MNLSVVRGPLFSKYSLLATYHGPLTTNQSYLATHVWRHNRMGAGGRNCQAHD